MKKLLIAVAIVVSSISSYAMSTTAVRVGEQNERMTIRTDLIDNQQRPVVIINHGDVYGGGAEKFRRNVKPTFGMGETVVEWWHSKGFHVVAPLRRGYGQSGNHYSGDFNGCNNPDMFKAGKEQAEDVMATVQWVKSQPWFNGQIVLEGQSGGGSAVVFAAASNDPAVRAVVNFSGLRGSRNDGTPCGLEQQNTMMAQVGRATQVPQFWVYAANDPKISADVANKWANIVNRNGGNVKLLVTDPIYKKGEDNGHSVMIHTEMWNHVVTKFLKEALHS